jgi:hypothetical protein
MFKSIQTADLYVQLVFDGLNLFIPQQDVLSVEIMADLEYAQTTMGAIGWFGQHGHGQNSPVFCLSEDLLLLTELPRSREFFILLKPRHEGELPVGITCDQVEDLNVRYEHLYIQDLPTIMHTKENPVSKLLIYKEQVACICTGADLVQHIVRLTEEFTHASESMS